jgi:hypothetical protein
MKPLKQFALQPGSPSDKVGPPSQNRRITLAQLKSPELAGVTIRLRHTWADYIGFVEESAERARRAGKLYTILLMGGVAQPWLAKHVRLWEKHAMALASRFAADPACWGVHVTGGSYTSHSEELHGGGYTDQFARCNEQFIDLWSALFPRQSLLLAISGEESKFDFPDKPSPVMERLIRYGVKRVGARFIAKHNAMAAKSVATAGHNELVKFCESIGGRYGFEMLCDSALSRWGGTLQQGANAMKAVAQAAGSPATYAAWYPPDLPRLSKIKW